MDQPNLIDLNTFFFLKGLLDGKYLIFWLEIKGLLASCQGFDKDLCRMTPKDKENEDSYSIETMTSRANCKQTNLPGDETPNGSAN
jgi:hypothetical protein